MKKSLRNLFDRRDMLSALKQCGAVTYEEFCKVSERLNKIYEEEKEKTK